MGRNAADFAKRTDNQPETGMCDVPHIEPSSYQGDMTSRVNMIGSVFSMFEFPEGDVAVNLDGGSS
ncbi:hypothetical protein OKW38_000516 [Paraburkholderia sp. MM5496-R1]